MLTGYLLLMVAVGVYFTKKNKDTEDFFRGGKQIPWWAAGCSIFATMLSSLTFTGIPSKAFAHDWVMRLHGKWFGLSRENFDTVHYGGMALYKIAIMLLCVGPLIGVVVAS